MTIFVSTDLRDLQETSLSATRPPLNMILAEFRGDDTFGHGDDVLDSYLDKLRQGDVRWAHPEAIDHAFRVLSKLKAIFPIVPEAVEPTADVQFLHWDGTDAASALSAIDADLTEQLNALMGQDVFVKLADGTEQSIGKVDSWHVTMTGDVSVTATLFGVQTPGLDDPLSR